MFDIAQRHEFMPRSTFDARVGEDEFLECGSGGTDGSHLLLWDFWRVSPGGMATLVRAYQEDHFHNWSSSAGSAPRDMVSAPWYGRRDR